jgi:hypothetical protein
MTLILTAPDCPAISLSPFALPYGQTSTTYNQQIRAAGGLAPYTFALTSGALPDGLSLSSDGILLGTPTTTGSSTFSITATDFTGCAGIQPYTVRVTGGCTDINPPTVTLTNPKNNSPVTTATITAQGIATDNVSVDQLLVGLDSDPLQKATLVYGATHKSAVWSASLTATPGQHRIIVVGVDSCGNNTTIVKSFFEVSPTPMVLTLNGYGSVTGPARLSVGANQLNIGQTYTFNAVPSPNNLFSNLIIYQDDVPNIVTNPKRVSFTMGSNTAITLNFVTNWFIDAAGKYAGLYDTGGSSINHSDSGSIGFNVTKGQTFSGALYRHGQKLGFAGKFDLDGNGMLTRTAGTTTPTDILVSHNGQITCTVTGDSMASAGATAYKAAFSAPNPCPLGGFNYTFILPGAVGLPTVPAGDGYATIKIASNGVATFTGKYADGAALSMSAPLSLDLKLPFYQALYQQPGTTPATFAGSAIGWLSLDSPPSLVRTSNITWSHGAFAGIPYAAGFTNPIAATAWLYVRPLTGLPSIAVPNMGIVLQDGGLSSAIVITDAKYVGTPPKITIPMASNPYKLTLSIAPQTGLMTGHFVPISGQPAVNIFGAVMQSDNSATGFFLGTDSTGAKFSGYSTAQDQLKANPRH